MSVYRSFDSNLFLPEEDATVFGVVHRGECAYLCLAHFFAVPISGIFKCLIEHKHDISISDEVRQKIVKLELYVLQRVEGSDSLPAHLYMCNEMGNLLLYYLLICLILISSLLAAIVAKDKGCSILYFFECDDENGYQAIHMFSPPNANAGI